MIPVVFSTDHFYVTPTIVAIRSLLKHTNDVEIYCLVDSSIGIEDRRAIESECKDFNTPVNFIKINDELNDGYETRGITKAAYYRLLIPWLIPNHNKVIYLDGDIIVKRDIKDLYSCNLGDDLIAGINTPSYYSEKINYDYIKSLDLDPHTYINSGILVFNSGLIREGNYKQELINKVGLKLMYQDQDIINLVFKGKIKHLDFIYNFAIHQIKYIPERHLNIADACIIHYSGLKPWKSLIMGYREWWNTYEETNIYNPNNEINFIRNLNEKNILQNKIRIILHKLSSKFFKHRH